MSGYDYSVRREGNSFRFDVASASGAVVRSGIESSEDAAHCAAKASIAWLLIVACDNRRFGWSAR